MKVLESSQYQAKGVSQQLCKVGTKTEVSCGSQLQVNRFQCSLSLLD